MEKLRIIVKYGGVAQLVEPGVLTSRVLWVRVPSSPLKGKSMSLEIQNFREFVKNPEKALKVKNLKVFYHDERIYTVNSGDEIFQSVNYDNKASEIDKETFLSYIEEEYDYDFQVGFIHNGNYYIDADMNDDRDNFILQDKLPNVFFLSFNCMSKLDEEWQWKIQNNVMIFKDQTNQSLIKFKKGERTTNNKKQHQGYTALYVAGHHYWHKSGEVLIYDTKSKKSYLLGQDEGQYFGVELPTNPKNIKEAIELLKPKEIKGIKNYQRQGEWFIVPIKNKIDLKTVKYNIGTIEFDFPKDNDESNSHSFTGSALILNDGSFVLNKGFLDHDQHQTIHINKPSLFIRNTSLRSVSTEGVD